MNLLVLVFANFSREPHEDNPNRFRKIPRGFPSITQEIFNVFQDVLWLVILCCSFCYNGALHVVSVCWMRLL